MPERNSLPRVTVSQPSVQFAGPRRAVSGYGNVGSDPRAALSSRAQFPYVLPAWAWMAAIGLVIWGTFTANPKVTVFAVSLLPIFGLLVWRPGEPPVLLFACGMQWLQASAAIFYTNYYRTSLAQAFDGPELERATWLTLLAVLTVALGMRTALLRTKTPKREDAVREALRLSPHRLFLAYLIMFVAFSVLGRIAFLFPGVTQGLLALVSLKWVLVYLLGFSIFEQRRNYLMLLIASGLEFVTGFLGYFSTFKSIFFVLLMVVLTSPVATRGRRLMVTLGIALALFAAGTVWTAIKMEYRDFLSQGSGGQEVVVPVRDRLDKLQQLVSTLTWDRVEEGFEDLVLRVGYVVYFAYTTMHVPESVPYENGALWLGAVKHVFTPRILFPEKGQIHDSERTEQYTGIKVAGPEEGTSISIGYVGESYVDFGPVLMFVPIYLLGLFYGLIYRLFVLQYSDRLLGFAVGTAILVFGAYNVETSNVKLVGGNVGILVVLATMTALLGKSFMRAMRK